MRFAPPDLLFLGQVEKPERVYLASLLPRLGYPTLHEPCCGAFAVSSIGRSIGYEPEQIHASDIALFSAVIGCLLTGESLDNLGVVYEGQPVESEEPLEQAALILWSQLLARLRLKPDVEYWHEIIADLLDSRVRHLHEIRRMLIPLMERLRGITYTREDMHQHILRASADPEAVSVVMTPTYKGGFEKFFNTGELMLWNEPQYEVFDPEVGAAGILALTQDRPGLVIVSHKAETGKMAGEPVYARALGGGESFYILSNRPGEIIDLMGLRVQPRAQRAELEALEYPIIGVDEEIPEDAPVGVIRIGRINAAYYRQLWMHRITTGETAIAFAAIVDGKVVGVAGISYDTMQMPLKGAVWADAPMIRYACGAPHNTYRFGRLMTMLCLNRMVMRHTATPGVSLHAEAAERLVTTCYTNYPEAKYLRGIMKLVAKEKGVYEKYRLVYGAKPLEERVEDTYRRWHAKEMAYASR